MPRRRRRDIIPGPLPIPGRFCYHGIGFESCSLIGKICLRVEATVCDGPREVRERADPVPEQASSQVFVLCRLTVIRMGG